jgi:type II secretory pathway component PulJ
MPVFDISIDIYLLILLLAFAMLAGFLGRSRQIAKRKRRIAELEREMMQAHAELLEMQRDYCELESSLKEGNSPVIPIKKKNEMPIGPDPGRTRKSSSTGTNGSPGGG